MQCLVEQIPLTKEPPLDEKCKDQFLLEITPIILEQEVLSLNDVVGFSQVFLIKYHDNSCLFFCFSSTKDQTNKLKDLGLA